MKILQIVSSLSQSNGVMNVIMNYYRELYKYNIIFDFLYFEESEINFKEEILSLGGNTIYIGKNNKIKTIKAFKNFFKVDFNYDIIENHELYLTNLIDKKKSKLILHSHTIKYSQKFLSMIRNRILCLGIEKKADYLASCSLKSGETFWKKYIRTEKFKKIPNAIPYEKCKYESIDRDEIRKKYKIEKDKHLLGYVARFDEGKNQQLLIQIIKKLNNDYQLMLVGNGKKFNNIQKYLKNNNLDKKVILTGQINSFEVKKYLSAMDMFLFPSKNEGLGQAAIEAQGNGLFCIISTGVPKEVKISQNCVFLRADNKNINAWVKQIECGNLIRKVIDFKKTRI